MPSCKLHTWQLPLVNMFLIHKRSWVFRCFEEWSDTSRNFDVENSTLLQQLVSWSHEPAYSHARSRDPNHQQEEHNQNWQQLEPLHYNSAVLQNSSGRGTCETPVSAGFILCRYEMVWDLWSVHISCHTVTQQSHRWSFWILSTQVSTALWIFPTLPPMSSFPRWTQEVKV